jgi:hypothetical protein
MEDVAHQSENRTRPTLAGWAVLLSAPAFVMAGLIRTDPAMVSVGLIAGAAVVLAYGFARRHGRNLTFQVILPPHVEAGRRFVCRICVWNTSRWCDVWRLRLRVHPLVLEDGEASLAWVRAKDAAVADVEALVEKRCRIHSVRIEWSTDAPFGLMMTRRSVDVPTAMLVRPKATWPWKNHQRGACGARTADASRTAGWGEWGEPRGARPWRSGDRAKHILWPATMRSLARGSVWMVRELDPPTEGWASYTVLFHSHGGGGVLIRPDSFEQALSHVAGVVKKLISEGRTVRFVADFHDWRPWKCRNGHSLSRLLDDLATAERVAGTEAHEIARVLEAVGPEEGIVVLSDFPVKSWRSAIPECARRAWLPDTATGMRKRLEVAK